MATASIGLKELLDGEVYGGNGFSVARVGDAWTIYYFVGEGLPLPGAAGFGAHEKIVLGQDEMDELRDYFVKFYAEDRGEIVPAVES